MRWLAIDFGTKKCGIAITDHLKIIAQPLKIIFYETKDFKTLINEIKKVFIEYEPIEKIILGISKNIDGSISNTGKITLKFKEILENNFKETPIVLFDEKYSTKSSIEVMKEMNLSKKDKKNKKDAIAAQKILEAYMLFNK